MYVCSISSVLYTDDTSIIDRINTRVLCKIPTEFRAVCWAACCGYKNRFKITVIEICMERHHKQTTSLLKPPQAESYVHMLM